MLSLIIIGNYRQIPRKRRRNKINREMEQRIIAAKENYLSKDAPLQPHILEEDDNASVSSDSDEEELSQRKSAKERGCVLISRVYNDG